MSRLAVDRTRCDGHGLCAALLPDGIARDEWGFPVVAPSEVAERDARRAIAACPSLALYLSVPAPSVPTSSRPTPPTKELR
jgi:ferredoxin